MRIDTAVCLLPAIVLLLLPLGRPAGAQRITVGTTVHVSTANPNAGHAEYWADADPAHPERLMACSILWSARENRVSSGIYVTFDGGQRWQYTPDTTSQLGGVSDPWCTYGLGGHAFFVTLASAVGDSMSEQPTDSWETWPEQAKLAMRLNLYRSADGGRSWQGPVALGYIDQEKIQVDRTDGPYRGRIYIYGNEGEDDKNWLVYSTDSGRTFTRSVPTPIEPKIRGYQFGVGTILPDGTLLIPYSEYEKENLAAVAASTDGGVHLSKPVLVAYGQQCQPGGPGMGFTMMASDHSKGPFRGRAYLLWGQFYRGHCTVMLSSSDDRGQTWSTPIQVSDEPRRPASQPGPDIGLPVVAVNNAGVVGIQWYDRREDPRNQNYRLRFTASLDGGETWLPSVPVSAHPSAFDGSRGMPLIAYGTAGGGSRRRPGAKAPFRVLIGTASHKANWQVSPGDYAGLAADARGTFHAFWVDNRGRVGGVGQLYTAPVTVSGHVVRMDAAPPGLTDVTSRLEQTIRSTTTEWAADSAVVTLEYTLLNTSRDTITGPLKLRVTSLSSHRFVPPAVWGAEHKRWGGQGTIIDLTPALPPGGLRPGQTLPVQHLCLKFDVRDREALHSMEAGPLASLQLRVFGNPSDSF